MTIEENRNIQKVLAQIAKQRRSERRGFGFALAVIGFAAMLFFSVFLGVLFVLCGAVLFLANLD